MTVLRQPPSGSPVYNPSAEPLEFGDGAVLRSAYVRAVADTQTLTGVLASVKSGAAPIEVSLPNPRPGFTYALQAGVFMRNTTAAGFNAGNLAPGFARNAEPVGTGSLHLGQVGPVINQWSFYDQYAASVLPGGAIQLGDTLLTASLFVVGNGDIEVLGGVTCWLRLLELF